MTTFVLTKSFYILDTVTHHPPPFVPPHFPPTYPPIYVTCDIYKVFKKQLNATSYQFYLSSLQGNGLMYVPLVNITGSCCQVLRSYNDTEMFKIDISQSNNKVLYGLVLPGPVVYMELCNLEQVLLCVFICMCPVIDVRISMYTKI